MSAGRSLIAELIMSRVDGGKAIRIVAALAQNLALLGVAQVREVDFVELQIAAARVGESLDRAAIGEREIVVKGFHVRIDVRADGAPAAAEVQHARRRDGHLRGSRAGVVAQEAEVIDHRMRREPNLAGDAQPLGLGFDAALECDAVIRAE